MKIIKRYIFTIIFSVFIILFIIVLYNFYLLKENQNLLKERIHFYEKSITDLRAKLSDKDQLIKDQQVLLQATNAELRRANKLGFRLSDAVAKAEEAARVFNKLNTIDKELLEKYSKVYFLNEHYVPKKLQDIPKKWVYSNKPIKIREEVAPFLFKMLQDMEVAGLSPRIVSAYRSFNTQKKLKYTHKVLYGTTEANKFVADQGYSEHQLGSTVDITDAKTGGLNGFENTKEFKWLKDNAYKYGFILSYPKGNKYYAYEPWHWRFVGKRLAKYLYENELNFYDLPQRKIDSFRIYLFDN